MPRSTSVPFRRVQSSRTVTTFITTPPTPGGSCWCGLEAPLEPSREARQRIAERQVEARAEEARAEPAAHVDRRDRHLLRQLDDRDDGDERRVLQQRDEVVRHAGEG